ncbi:hypothetical protein [Rhizobium leguminosarum]|uniref:hypothetical protein n=1 Tax=Rhizobium leguminosarum TaxID=384 RepID=UPI001C9671CB|nr:hypothetical protein [Rhizobium leguminosarum]MBY5660928.1 hypothetical protein [Rhizobium leguminosarum]MBY5674964.1 hypothetical protein [Rhizobium leguminosarum]
MKEITYGFSHLSDLVDRIMEHLETASNEARIATAFVLSVHRSTDLLGAIRDVLDDPYFSGYKIAAIGSVNLGLQISYQEDSVVYIADPSDPEDSAERAIRNLEASLGLAAP